MNLGSQSHSMKPKPVLWKPHHVTVIVTTCKLLSQSKLYSGLSLDQRWWYLILGVNLTGTWVSRYLVKHYFWLYLGRCFCLALMFQSVGWLKPITLPSVDEPYLSHLLKDHRQNEKSSSCTFCLWVETLISWIQTQNKPLCILNLQLANWRYLCSQLLQSW